MVLDGIDPSFGAVDYSYYVGMPLTSEMLKPFEFRDDGSCYSSAAKSGFARWQGQD
jgi:hypothetical protein